MSKLIKLSIVILLLWATPSWAVQTYNVLAADLWYNGYNNTTDTPRQSDMASFKFTITSSTAFAITITASRTGGSLYMAYIPNGSLVETAMTFSAVETKRFLYNLSAGTYTIEIVNGGQTRCTGGPLGSFIDSVEYPDEAIFAVIPPSYSSKVVFYGDSITIGQAATLYSRDGYVGKLRYTYGYAAMAEADGCRALADDTPATLAARIAGYAPTAIWLAIGTNDFGMQKQSSTNFGTDYKTLLDALRLALPTVPIYCQSPLYRSSETELEPGWGDLDAYRTQVETQCGTVTNTKYVDGSVILAAGDFGDGVHPTTAGHVKYAAYVDTILRGGITPPPPVPGGGAGINNVAGYGLTINAVSGSTTVWSGP